MFAIYQTAGFIGRMSLHLREVFPDKVTSLDDRRLRLFVQKVCERGLEWHIKQESHMERLVELFVAFEQLRSNPLPESLQNIVQDPERPGEQVIDLLENELLFAKA